MDKYRFKYYLAANLILLFLAGNVHAAPSTSMNITPSAVSGATISASDENARNNEISTKYNSHTHNDVVTLGNTINIGDGNAGDKTINAKNNDANLPYIKWDDTNEIWVSSRDGVTVDTFLVMTGADVGQSIFPQSPANLSFLQFDTTDDQWESTVTPDINGGTIDGVTIGASAAPTVTNLGSVATADINGGTIDGVTIGATSAPTVTNLGSVATADINGGTIDGVTIGGSSSGSGTFTDVQLAEQGSDVSTGANEGVLYTKDVASNTELFYRDESDGSVVQLTDGGDPNPSFGSWTTATENASTQASTDGFIIMIADGTSQDVAFSIKTDSANPPTVIRATNDTNGTTTEKISAMSPVKKNDYYLLEATTGSLNNTNSYFIPLGN